MASLSMEDVARLVIDRKFANPALAISVCWAESGGRTTAINVVKSSNPRVNGSRDRGLWQINSYWHSEVSDSCAFNAACNADQTYRISAGGTNWKPWTTYNHGSYAKYMKDAQTAVNRVSGEIPLPPPPPPGWPPYDPWTHQYSLWPLNTNKSELRYGTGYTNGTQHLQGTCKYFNDVCVFEAGQVISVPFEVFTQSSLTAMRNIAHFFNPTGANYGLAIEAYAGFVGKEMWKVIDFLASRKL